MQQSLNQQSPGLNRLSGYQDDGNSSLFVIRFSLIFNLNGPSVCSSGGKIARVNKLQINGIIKPRETDMPFRAEEPGGRGVPRIIEEISGGDPARENVLTAAYCLLEKIAAMGFDEANQSALDRINRLAENHPWLERGRVSPLQRLRLEINNAPLPPGV